MEALTHLVPPSARGRRLVDHVRDRLVLVAARQVGALIVDGAVTIDDRPAPTTHVLSGGERLHLDGSALAELHARGLTIPPGPVGMAIRYEDADLLVADKPAGIHVHPLGRYRDDTVVGDMLWRQGVRPDTPWGRWRPHLVNRLDRATSGLLAIATSRDGHTTLQVAIEQGRLRRTYVARVIGTMAGERGTIAEPLAKDPDNPYRRAVVAVGDGGQPAVTHWTVLARELDTTLVELELETGRTHQIRAHLAALGHPIVGDGLYVDGRRPTFGDTIELHATGLSLPHPRTGEPIEVRSPAPWA